MNAFLHRFHNFILLLVRGKDRVCDCTCGRHQVYHVVPYNDVQPVVVSRQNDFLRDVMTQQEMYVMVGLLLGLCISWLLLLLNTLRLSGLKQWRANRAKDVDFWSWTPKFHKTRGLIWWLHPKHTGDSGGNLVHIEQDVYHGINGSI